MDKDLKIVFACVATYAVIGFNTFGFKYHRDVVATDEYSRRADATFAGLLWPGYWPARWSLQFWELPPAVTNVVYVDRPSPTVLVGTNVSFIRSFAWTNLVAQ